MSELLYLSRAKLRRWLSDPGGLSEFGRRTGGELGGGVIPAKFTIAPATGSTSDEAPLNDLLQRAIKDIESSDRLSRVTDNVAEPGQWFEFGGVMRYGKVRRNRAPGSADASANVVFFIGSFPEADPTVDVMLGGWIGHLLDETAVRDPALRMGSRTDHLYDLWDELAATEQDGSFEIPDAWRKLPYQPRMADYPSFDTICRWAYGMMDSYLPDATAGPLKGYAQVVARLADSNYDRPLILGTPLYVEYSASAEATERRETRRSKLPRW